MIPKLFSEDEIGTVEVQMDIQVTNMVDKDDWRLCKDLEHLKNNYINPTDGEEIVKHDSHLKECIFCWEKVQDNPHQWWFIPEDISCCICEECYNDFNEMFGWKKLDGWDIVWDPLSEENN